MADVNYTRPMGGVDQRTAPTLLPPDRLTHLNGLSPREGSLARLEGKVLRMRFPFPVLSIYQNGEFAILQTTRGLYVSRIKEELLQIQEYLLSQEGDVLESQTGEYLTPQ